MLRAPGPYRPTNLPKPGRDRNLAGFWWAAFLLFLVFSLAHIWKANDLAILCAHLDSLRGEQQELEHKLKGINLNLEEQTTYSKIEPLAREKLGMIPSPIPPVVLAPIDQHFAAIQVENKTSSRQKRE